MDLGWKWLIELAFIWVMVSGVIIVGRNEGWNLIAVVPLALLGGLGILGVLRASMPNRSELVEEIL